jgi:type IV pilus assembly protein PilC
VKQITTLMEPAVLIVMGVIVGFVALALVSAMYGIYGDASKR